MNPGSIVRCRNRDWVLMPSESADTHLLRPLTGAMDDVVAIHKGLTNLVGSNLPEERITPSVFQPPNTNDLSDAIGSHLLWQASRLTLREGASPFRSLGKISIRPRIYQLVPLLMALRLDPIRLLIADDVGVGKTAEALLIARELYDRGEIKRICVLCPANLLLCEHWQSELSQKFNLDAVIIRSGTINQLDRKKTNDQESIYKHYPIQVASIDFLKSDRNRALFLQDCPDLIIVDEAHGCAYASESNASKHQRHSLIKQITERNGQHMLFLTATPHSGIEGSFRSLISFLNPEFSNWNTSQLNEDQRIELARHFVQRTRKDIETNWENDNCFPERKPSDKTYKLTPGYIDLFKKTYAFCNEIVEEGVSLSHRERRVRNWGALALLSCVMSSPAAAIAALKNREQKLIDEDEDIDFNSWIFETSTEHVEDDQPSPVIDMAESLLGERNRRRLRSFARLSQELIEKDQDNKLSKCVEIVSDLLRNGFCPIVWCRFVATSEYVASGLQNRLEGEFRNLRTVFINGQVGEDERTQKLNELVKEKHRILVATDCFSEGINLQGSFNAIVHYDLPWNPNRLEQREGRVDRYGQLSKTVKAIRLYSPDNSIDGVLLNVLLNKAKEIHKVLGTYVPVPEESESVTETLLNALFKREERRSEQDTFDFEGDDRIIGFHKTWDEEVERERINRTRFAQRSIKPEEVRQEIENCDAVLGDPNAVREFVLNALDKLHMSCLHIPGTDHYDIPVNESAIATLPNAIKYSLPDPKIKNWKITFSSPDDAEFDYVGRNHRFVSALARYFLEEALTKSGSAKASRCGVIKSNEISRLTTIVLLRVRYLIKIPQRAPMLSEEVFVTGYVGQDASEWLDEKEAYRLLSEVQPTQNIDMDEKRERILIPLDLWNQKAPGVYGAIEDKVKERAKELEASHKRVRKTASLRIRELKVEAQTPPDLLGVLVLVPAVES